MKTAERIFGFASCALGLLPLLGEQVKAQQVAPVACQADTVFSLANAGTTTLPVLVNPGAFGGQRVLVCGYSISGNGASTQSITLVYGGGTGCASILGFTTQTALSLPVPGGQVLARQDLAVVLAPNASICINSTVTGIAAELNYSIQ